VNILVQSVTCISAEFERQGEIFIYTNQKHLVKNVQITQWAKSPKKQSVGVYSLYFECQINQNALLQTVFLMILPTGSLILSIQIVTVHTALFMFDWLGS